MALNSKESNMPMPEKEKLPEEIKPSKPDLDKQGLAANESLLASRAYILFTMNDAEGNLSFIFDASKANDLETIGMLNIALETLAKTKAKLEYVNSFDDDDEDEDGDGLCDECRAKLEDDDD